MLYAALTLVLIQLLPEKKVSILVIKFTVPDHTVYKLPHTCGHERLKRNKAEWKEVI